MSDSSKERAYAKKEILEAAHLYADKHMLSFNAGSEEFVKAFNAGVINLSCSYQIKSISKRTLARWNDMYKKHGLQGLAGQYGKLKGRNIINSTPELYSFCLALLKEYPHIKGRQLHQSLKAKFTHLSSLPAEKTCGTWLINWKSENSSLFESYKDPDNWKNSYMCAFGNMSEEVVRINQLWEFDSTPADVMLTDGRYSIVGVIDVFTRRVKCVLRPTSNAEAIALLVREAVLDWGKPEIGRTDNGSDYTSNHIEQAFFALNIVQEKTTPYSGWEKPYIERFFRTFSHGISELLQGFIGHNVAERQQINARATFAKRLLERREKGEKKMVVNVNLSSEEFKRYINDWIEYHYHHSHHESLNCSPFEKFTQHKQKIVKISDERALDVLLAPIPSNKGIRTVTKGNGIEVEGNSFIDPELALFIGERVFCRYNPKDVGKIYVFNRITLDFICEAICPEIAGEGVSRQEIAIAAKQKQRLMLKQQRREITSTTNKHNVKSIAHEIIASKKQKNGVVTSFPKPSEELESSSITAAKKASEITPEETYSEEEKQRFAARRRELIAAEKNNHKREFESPLAKAQYLTRSSLERQLTPAEKSWLHKYRKESRASIPVLDRILQTTKTATGDN
jgi:transposase InsO family protein